MQQYRKKKKTMYIYIVTLGSAQYPDTHEETDICHIRRRYPDTHEEEDTCHEEEVS